jgi:hypothetical protein
VTIFLILAPYAAFAVLMLVTSAATSLFVSAAICLMVVGYDAARGRTIKWLGAGSAILFLSLGSAITLFNVGLSPSAVKLCVDAGMLMIALVSLVIRRPFTLQYAREVVDAEIAATPGFLKANYVITGAWAIAFALMMLANLLLIYIPGLPLWLGLLVAFAARNTALYFTKWYPDYRRVKSATAAASADV